MAFLEGMERELWNGRSRGKRNVDRIWEGRREIKYNLMYMRRESKEEKEEEKRKEDIKM